MYALILITNGTNAGNYKTEVRKIATIHNQIKPTEHHNVKTLDEKEDRH